MVAPSSHLRRTTPASVKPLQVALVEPVAYPPAQLVVKGADGAIESVQYHELIPMLLNEVQHQQLKLDAQAQQLTTQSQQFTTQGQQLAELKAQNARLEAAVVQQHAALAARLEQLEQSTHRLTTVSTR